MKSSFPMIVLLVVSLGIPALAGGESVVPSKPQRAILYRDGYAILEENLSATGPGMAIRLPAETDLTSVRALVDGKLSKRLELEEIIEEEASTDRTTVQGVVVEKATTIKKRVGYLLRPGATGKGQLSLRYATNGVSWEPRLGVEILDDKRASVTLTAVISNRALDLGDCRIHLASSAGQMPSKEYFSAASHHGYAPSGNYGIRSADMVYDAGRQNLGKDKTSLVTVLAAESKYENKLVWHTGTRERVRSVVMIPNPFPVALCPAPASLSQRGVLLSYDNAEWAPPGSSIVLAAGHVSEIEVEHSVDTTENRANRARPFRHVIKFRVTNRSTGPVHLEVVMPKMMGGQHKTLYKFKREPDQRPGELFIWNLELGAGKTEVIRFHFDSEYPRFSEYQTFEKARYMH